MKREVKAVHTLRKKRRRAESSHSCFCCWKVTQQLKVPAHTTVFVKQTRLKQKQNQSLCALSFLSKSTFRTPVDLIRWCRDGYWLWWSSRLHFQQECRRGQLRLQRSRHPYIPKNPMLLGVRSRLSRALTCY